MLFTRYSIHDFYLHVLISFTLEYIFGPCSNFQGNTHFIKKIPKDAEASSILVGETNLLEKPLVCFVRLSEATYIGDLTEVEIPTRFVFLLLGPSVIGFGSDHVVPRKDLSSSLVDL